MRLARAIVKQFQKGLEKRLDEEDFCSLVKLLEEDSGVKIK